MIELAKKAAIEVYDKELEKYLDNFLLLSLEEKLKEYLPLSSSIHVHYFKFWANCSGELRLFDVALTAKSSSMEECMNELFQKLILNLRKQLPKRFDQEDFREFIEELIS